MNLQAVLELMNTIEECRICEPFCGDFGPILGELDSARELSRLVEQWRATNG